MIKSNRAVLIEGAKGTGKSCTPLLALKQVYEDKAEDRFPIYYLNAERLQILGEAQVKKDLAEVPRDALVFFDDIHREPEQAPNVALDTLNKNKARLVFASRRSSTNQYEGLRRRFIPLSGEQQKTLFQISPKDNEAEFCGFIHDILASYRKPDNDDVVNKFYGHYQDDLTALFDAVETWQPPEAITATLADRRARERLEYDPDFEISAGKDAARAAFLAVAAFWQFERSLEQRYLGDLLGLCSEVAEDLSDKGLLIRLGEVGAREYQLDHEARARRYVRVAAKAPDFIQYLRGKFKGHGIETADEDERMADHLFLLDLRRHDFSTQMEQLRLLFQRIQFRGYGEDYLHITETFRKNENKLDSLTMVELLIQGGGIRRRHGLHDDAQEWLETAKALLGRETLNGAVLSRILYEEAYLLYDKNEFDKASELFKESARVTPEEVGRYISLAKSAEARFQAIVLSDPFSQNLRPLGFAGEGIDPSGLQPVRNELDGYLAEFERLSKDTSLSDSRRSDAKRWIANCLLHLADVCREQGEERIPAAKGYLERGSNQIDAEHLFSSEPVLQYLQGRLALLKKHPSKAVELLTQALEGYEGSEERQEGRGDVLITLGDAHTQNRNPSRGCHYYSLAQKVKELRRNRRAVAAANQRLKRVATQGI